MTSNSVLSNIIKIRAHHLLCMQGYQGYGYNQDFEHNMEKIIEYLDSNPNFPLEVVADADIICQKCPHLENGQCNRSSSTAIVEKDLKVLEKLGLAACEKKPAQKVLSEVESLSCNDLHDICGECSWKVKCLLYISK
ncbi:MAG TPA: DUF1284 domain-containing protein [Methanobacterium sp.]|nr:MAG: DUF1284 domain-containing protein [Methanobacterium sp.]HOI72314.1 DUF1284 domain-containing protein [Methanobacterium sp.]